MMLAGTTACNVHAFAAQLLQSTVVEADADPEPWLPLVEKVAMFMYLPQEFVVVVLTTCALVVVPAGTVGGLYTRLWVGGEPLIDQPGSVLAPSMAQLISLPDGSESLKDRPLASALPLFLSVTVKPICVPGITLGASAVLKIDTAGAGGGGGCGVHWENAKLPMRLRQLNVAVVA